MGLDYSIDLYFPIERVRDAIFATLQIASVHEGEYTIIVLPDGSELVVPFRSDLDTRQTRYLEKGERGITIDTVLTFDKDEAIEAYLQHEPYDYADQDQVSIGNIYLYITLGKQYARFAYAPATSAMCQLLVNSKSMQDTFLDILESAGGLFGLINIEEFHFPLLGQPDRLIYPIDSQDPDEYDDLWQDIDFYVEVVLDQLSQEV